MTAMGSTAIARRAGNQHASMATTAVTASAPPRLRQLFRRVFRFDSWTEADVADEMGISPRDLLRPPLDGPPQVA